MGNGTGPFSKETIEEFESGFPLKKKKKKDEDEDKEKKKKESYSSIKLLKQRSKARELLSK